jgi:hypothetical protein
MTKDEYVVHFSIWAISKVFFLPDVMLFVFWNTNICVGICLLCSYACYTSLCIAIRWYYVIDRISIVC